MDKQKIAHPDRQAGFDTGAYSDGVLVNGFLFLSGQAAVDFKTSEFVLGTIEEETTRTLDNLKAIIEAAGATMNEVYSTYFTGIKPARTTVQSVLAENLKVEIDCIVKMPV
jgi:2-iminobutanoate/2-iminopropanoate deaminase